MAHIKRDNHKQRWETDTEFPLVCETCLGDNPYVRMTKDPHGKKCSVCETPFTVFAWQAGTKGRLKKVEICRSCAQAKNCCQVCLYDLQYGLPIKVRDQVLKEAGATGSTAALTVPQSMANRSWFSNMQQRKAERGESMIATNDLAHAKLTEMAQMEPRYERNLPKLCSFFAKGECNRGASCPFRHELPKDRNDPRNQAPSTKGRFYGTDDSTANRILGRKRRQEEEEAKREDDDGISRARATLYLRFQGDSPFPSITEADVRDKFYSFGEIVAIRLQADKGQAFVEYTQPEATELAIFSMNKKDLLGRKLFVAWARAPKHGEAGSAGDEMMQGRDQGSSSGVKKMKVLAPPGGSSSKPLPKNLKARVPGLSSVPRPGLSSLSSVPRPGASKTYPRTNPSRLGS